ncbi:MAG: IS66 family insertion sequence element accessory protein TnpB, partial [Clostridiales bacterium]
MDPITLAKNQYRTQQWADYIQERKTSGMTINAWCERKGLNPRSYYYWLRKLRQEVSQEHQQQIVPVTVTPSFSPKR